MNEAFTAFCYIVAALAGFGAGIALMICFIALAFKFMGYVEDWEWRKRND